MRNGRQTEIAFTASISTGGSGRSNLLLRASAGRLPAPQQFRFRPPHVWSPLAPRVGLVHHGVQSALDLLQRKRFTALRMQQFSTDILCALRLSLTL